MNYQVKIRRVQIQLNSKFFIYNEKQLHIFQKCMVQGQRPKIIYWAMGLSEDTKLSEERPVIIRGPTQDLICKRHLEECPRGKSLSEMDGMSRICIPAAGGTFQETQEMRTCLINTKEEGGTQKYLRKSYYHRIECTITTFLTAFMCRRHLNSEVLAITTHRKPGEVSDGTSTQVISQTIEKCKVKMIQRELYNVKNPL